MWGTRLLWHCSLLYRRFIPTHVGNSLQSCRAVVEFAVHPHTCGELETANLQMVFGVGSSPHMWGTPLEHQVRERIERFIPTHVGNSVSGTTSSITSTVHPHTCGELFRNANPIKASCGSSPHMWGTLFLSYN